MDRNAFERAASLLYVGMPKRSFISSHEDGVLGSAKTSARDLAVKEHSTDEGAGVHGVPEVLVTDDTSAASVSHEQFAAPKSVPPRAKRTLPLMDPGAGHSFSTMKMTGPVGWRPGHGKKFVPNIALMILTPLKLYRRSASDCYWSRTMGYGRCCKKSFHEIDGCF